MQSGNSNSGKITREMEREREERGTHHNERIHDRTFEIQFDLVTRLKLNWGHFGIE